MLTNKHTHAEAIGLLNAELAAVNAYCDLLKGALIDLGVDVPGREIIDTLMDSRVGPQGRNLLGILVSRYPKVSSRWLLLESLPGTIDRQVQIIGVLVSRLRQVLGRDAIVTVHHSGYVLSPEAYARLTPPSLTPE